MLKKYLPLYLISTMIMATLSVNANSTIYTDDLGRMHFMGKGGYSGVRQMQNGEMQAGAINDAVEKYSKTEVKVDTKKKEVVEAVEKTNEKAEQKITDVIKEKPVVPAASYKSSYSYEKGKMDASNPYGFAGTNIPSGVNDSKTIYTDELGRLHFFGKGNVVKENK